LVERFGERLYRFLSHKTENVQDAEDLVQDTLIKAYRNIHRYRNSNKFSTWLFTIARRLASSHYRGLRRSQRIVDLESQSPEPADVMAEQEEQQSLWAAARDLSRSQYQALRLRYAEDMSIKEIAQVLRKTQVSVKVLLYRARVNLGQRLADMAAEDKRADEVSSKETLSFMKVEGA
jgi:RNA polymerase sigma-70 factor (ECF subfamily)